MRSPRRSFTPEFRVVAVTLANNGQSLSTAARELNISPQLLRSWIIKTNKNEVIHNSDRCQVAQEQELILLKKENAQLRLENKRIKNAVFYISKGQSHKKIAPTDRSDINTSLSVPDISMTVLPEYYDQVSTSDLVTLPQNRSNKLSNKNTIHVCIGRHYMNLSKLHKKTADYVLSNILRAATISIDELANAAGISIATAHRFSRVLGFDSYQKFRAEVVSTLDAMLTPVANRQTQSERIDQSYEVIPGSLNEYLNNAVLHVN